MENTQEQARILTEEELKNIERISGIMLNRDNDNMTTRDVGLNKMFMDLMKSHRSLLSANAELSFEIMIRKHYEGFLKSVARSGEILEERRDFEWFKERWQSIENLVLEVSHE